MSPPSIFTFLFQPTVNDKDDVGLIIGLSVGMFFLLFFVGIPVCILVVRCYAARKTHRSVVQTRTRIVATNPNIAETPEVTPNQASTSFSTPLQQPVIGEAQFSCEDAPPSYADATAFPPSAEVTNNTTATLTFHTCK